MTTPTRGTRAKIAVSVPAGLVKRARADVRAGHARSLSAYVTQALAERQQREDLVSVLAAMDAEHGPPTAAERDWAQHVLGG